MFFSTVLILNCVLSQKEVLVPFLPVFSMEAPCIPHAFPSQTVFDLLSQQHNKLCHFISDTMGYFLAGIDQQQTNQPNNQAGNWP